jgi:hypothetical protein
MIAAITLAGVFLVIRIVMLLRVIADSRNDPKEHINFSIASLLALAIIAAACTGLFFVVRGWQGGVIDTGDWRFGLFVLPVLLYGPLHASLHRLISRSPMESIG